VQDGVRLPDLLDLLDLRMVIFCYLQVRKCVLGKDGFLLRYQVFRSYREFKVLRRRRPPAIRRAGIRLWRKNSTFKIEIQNSSFLISTSSINTDAILFTTEAVANLNKVNVFPNLHSELIRWPGSKKVKTLFYAA